MHVTLKGIALTLFNSFLFFACNKQVNLAIVDAFDILEEYIYIENIRGAKSMLYIFPPKNHCYILVYLEQTNRSCTMGP